MAAGFIRLIGNLLVPDGILFFIIVCMPAFFPLHQKLWPYAPYYPYFFYIIAAALCWRFHKDRAFFALICIAIAERAIYYLLAAKGGRIQTDALLYDAIGVVLPLSLVVFEFVKDRGVFTFWGVLRWILILAAVFFLGSVYLKPEAALTIAARDCLSALETDIQCVLPDPVAGVFFLSLLALAVRFLVRRLAFESAAIWVLILLFLGLRRTENAAITAYYASSAAVIFIAAILETSYRLAYYDDLTGLPARRALNDQLMRLGSRYTIAMADIDHFKKFNDRYGHDVGDQVLKMVAAKLKAVSGGGKPFRYGGEEFAIIFSGETLAPAKACLESLRKAIETTKFTLRGFGRAFKRKKPPTKKTPPRKTVKITVSIGVAEKTDRHADAHAVIKAADKALYRAKRAGRNRVAT